MSFNRKTWNYDHPIDLWESWPWWFRWPAGVALTIYFGGALLMPFLL